MEVDPEHVPTNLTSEALKRKERLQKLREQVTGKNGTSEESSKPDECLPK